MPLQYNPTTQKIRNNVRLRLQNHPKLHKFAVYSHRKYCTLTGCLHVLPDYLILGAQKSGTNSLYWYLRQHPYVKRATTKEILFFDKYYDRGLDWYRVNFPLKIQKDFLKILGKDLLTGEATERYLDHPLAPYRVKESIPNVKFIILLRNPIDRAYSHYNMRHGAGNEPLSFEEAIQKEQDRTKGEFEKMQKDETYYSMAYFHHSYLDRGIYVDKIKRWMSVFPKEQFLILQSEEFLKNTSSIYKKVLKFLELPEWELLEYEEVGRAEYKHPKMNDDTRQKLIEFFRSHNKRLYEFLGVNYNWED